MQVGDLIRIVLHKEVSDDIQSALLYVTEVAPTGVSVIVVSGSHFGSEFFLPVNSREIEIISSIDLE